MPTVHVYMIAGRTPSQKESLIHKVTDAVVESLEAPTASVRVIISEIPKSDYGIGGETAERLGR